MFININNVIDPKFAVSDHVRISKYKNIFTKGYAPNWSEEVFEIKISVQRTFVIEDLNELKIVKSFQRSLKLIKR